MTYDGPDYQWWRDNGSKVKARLTRSERKLTNPWPERPTAEVCRAALAEAEAVRALMDEHGYPDWWSRVDRLASDARYALSRVEAGL